MKTFVVLAVSIVLVGILFCPVAMAAPPMPNDVQMVEPDPSLPKEIAGFWGKWEGSDRVMQYFLIVEKIDGEKATIYGWRSGSSRGGIPEGWRRSEAKVIKEYGKYKIWFRYTVGGSSGNVEYTLKGKDLDCSYETGGWGGAGSYRLTRVP